MTKIMGLVISFILILSLLTSLLGIPLHNYEVRKCSTIAEHVYDEAYSDCYMPLFRPAWNLFWNVFGLFIISLVISGFMGVMIGFIREEI